MSHYVLHTAEGVIKQVLMLQDDAPAPSVDGLTTLAVSGHVDGTRNHVAEGAIVAGLLDLRTAGQRAADAAAAARAERDARLASCDWVVIRAAETAQAVPGPWTSYRAALRDVPLQAGFPGAIDWPAAPA